jgi:hypothetical protein
VLLFAVVSDHESIPKGSDPHGVSQKDLAKESAPASADSAPTPAAASAAAAAAATRAPEGGATEVGGGKGMKGEGGDISSAPTYSLNASSTQPPLATTGHDNAVPPFYKR